MDRNKDYTSIRFTKNNKSKLDDTKDRLGFDSLEKLIMYLHKIGVNS